MKAAAAVTGTRIGISWAQLRQRFAQAERRAQGAMLLLAA